ncbi:ABC transporter permease [Nocardia puris]|uniref:ABC-2 type transport system permease protein n=1 Tax=Nocardia puris TaxID=208602 RepID=A0A366D932_9NOCA|nr:ABC transporter permease [Nocardia puris]MBF6214036.1 ABC transporter permease [Nocardia puris]MBF6368681.1 ABC transporter permease [Nocardia puris]MBF6461582.1 ABC transporter permease [Nocardia puris]RBO86543.1 ABC-2 type transport system permease protein [Nocardia puris]
MTTTFAPGAARRRLPTEEEALTGTVVLVRFALRRDRVKLPAWIAGIAFMGLYYAAALPQIYRTDEDLRAVGRFGQGVVGALVSGPGYGLSDPSVESVIVGIYGLYFLLLAALMNILLVSRHTRVEEQSGRAELVRADVVGRHAQLTAALLVAALANALLALAIAAVFPLTGASGADALLFGAGVGAVGLVFAAITAVTVQITEYSRAAAGLAGAALGGAYVIRAAGDALREGGSALSWLSPLAWSQQTRAYADGRWWPLALSVALALGAAALAYALSRRRDLGAGLVPPRPGSPTAARWLNSPVALAFRLQRASLFGWGAALAAGGALYGGIGDAVVDSFDDLPEEVVAVMGGDASRMLDGYVGTMALFDALLVAVFAILAVQGLRTEETKGRAEPVLATAVSRRSWFTSHLLVTAAGVVTLLLVTGAVLGSSIALSVGDADYLWEAIAAHVVYAPAVLLIAGVAALLYGVAPAGIGVTWALLGFGMILGFFGPIMDLPAWVSGLSPLEHVARLPMEPMRWQGPLTLTALAAAAAAAGRAGFGRRDLDMK